MKTATLGALLASLNRYPHTQRALLQILGIAPGVIPPATLARSVRFAADQDGIIDTESIRFA